MLRPGLPAAAVPALLGLAMASGVTLRAGAQPKEARAADVAVIPAPSVGPGRGNGERTIPRALSSPPSVQGAAGALAGERTSRGGRLSALPPEATKAPASDRIRRSIAGGATRDDLKSGHGDPELRALREAERRLFPRSVVSTESAFDLALPSSVTRPGPALSTSGLPLGISLVASARPAPHAWPRGLSLPNLPVAFEERTLGYVRFYRDSARGRAIAEAWARKAGRYAPAIQAELARAGLPTDLVWLSLIESGHNPTIRSPAGAAGLWQFIPESARLYGLTVDRWVDERLDPLRSTRAAAVYLSDLHQRFGTWELAMAAYNMGHSGLTRSIRKYNTNDFWRLSRMEAALPWETSLYVPKVLAVAIVMRNKRAFGLGDVPADPAVSFDTVYVPAGVPLASIAERAGVSASAIASLNPQYLASRTPPPSDTEPDRLWAVHVPEGHGPAVTRRLSELSAGRARQATYQVRLGDTLASVAQRLGGPAEELRQLNELAPGERLSAGSRLLVPKGWAGAASRGAAALREDTESSVVMQPQRFRYPDRERVFYRTLPGDDLATLARAFQVRPEDLVIWNGLDGRAELLSDMVLAVYLPSGSRPEGIRFVRAANAGEQLEVGSPRFFAHFEAEQGRQRLTIVARDGETLSGIGKRYGLSPGTMERINHMSRNERLEEGTPVVVYAKNGPSAAELFLSRGPEPLPPVDPPYPAFLPGAAPN